MFNRISRCLVLAVLAASSAAFAQVTTPTTRSININGGAGTVTINGNVVPAKAVAKLQANDVVAICGDSITEQRQYTVNMELYFLACQPAPNIRAFQAGWGGEWALGFNSRLERDVLPFKPTVVTTCYGMNDSRYGPMDPSKDKGYREPTLAYLQKLKVAGIREIVLGSPGAVDTGTWSGGKQAAIEAQNGTLAAFRDIDKEIAQQQNITFADLHTPMIEAMKTLKAKYGSKYHVAGGDGVHPDANGHIVMAYAFLTALGCDGNIGTITVDLASSKATATAGHTVKSAAAGTVEVVSTKYPFCFTGDPKSPSATTGVLEAIPFNQKLNRFMLVVNNAGADKLKITWGTVSKEFSAQDAAKGINLADAFLDNPFSVPFEKVKKAVQEQQNFETPLTKDILHNIDRFKVEAPEVAAAYAAYARAAIEHDAALADRAAKSVEPVTHTIKIEVVK